MTLAELRSMVRDILGDQVRKNQAGTTLSGPTSWSDSQIDAGLNFAQTAYAKTTQCTMTSATLTASSGIVSLPSSSLGFAGHVDVSASAGGTMNQTTPAFENLKSATWHSETGTPARWFPLGERTLRVIPSGNVTVNHLAAPVEMGSDGASPDATIPTTHHKHLAMAGAAWCLLQDGDGQNIQAAGALMDAFRNAITAPGSNVDDAVTSAKERASHA